MFPTTLMSPNLNGLGNHIPSYLRSLKYMKLTVGATSTPSGSSSEFPLIPTHRGPFPNPHPELLTSLEPTHTIYSRLEVKADSSKKIRAEETYGPEGYTYIGNGEFVGNGPPTGGAPGELRLGPF